MIVFDHLKLVHRDLAEVIRFRKFLQDSAGRTVPIEMTTMHEEDNSCCKQESWAVTLRTLMSASDVQSLIVRPKADGSLDIENPKESDQ
jgi:aspartate carbamoyltransferase catalytic subunit